MELDVGQRYGLPQRRVEDFLREHLRWLHVQPAVVANKVDNQCLLIHDHLLRCLVTRDSLVCAYPEVFTTLDAVEVLLLELAVGHGLALVVGSHGGLRCLYEIWDEG